MSTHTVTIVKQHVNMIEPLIECQQIVDLNYGMGQLNPIDHVRFYSKDNPQQAMKVRKSEVSHRAGLRLWEAPGQRNMGGPRGAS